MIERSPSPAPSAPTDEVECDAEIGRSIVAAIGQQISDPGSPLYGWSPADRYDEVIGDLVEMVHAAREPREPSAATMGKPYSPHLPVSRAQLRALRAAMDGGLFKVCGPHWMAYGDRGSGMPARWAKSITVNRLVSLGLLSKVLLTAGQRAYLTQAGADVVEADDRERRQRGIVVVRDPELFETPDIPF